MPEQSPDLTAFTDDLGRLVRQLLDAAPPEVTPVFPAFLHAHFESDLAALPIVSDTFPTADHANLQLALDAWLTGVPHRIVGLVGLRVYDANLATLTAPARHQEIGLGPVHYIERSTSVDELLPCVHTALICARHRDAPVAVLVHGPEQEWQDGITCEVLAPTREVGEHVLATLRDGVRRRNVYRGKVLSLSTNTYGHARLEFHALPDIPRDRIVLPSGLLERIERHTIGFSRHAATLRASGRHLRRGLLLHGPPGTGKTLTAMHLARHLPDRTTLLVTGQGQGLIETTCTLARRLAPSLVIVEDVDLIAAERTNEQLGCAPLLFELLNQMDGLGPDLDIVFLLTTNRPELLEPALTARPGRIDLAVEVPLPDARCRADLLALYGAGLDLAAVDLEAVVARTDGVSAAFIRELLRKAALFAADAGSGTLVANDHVDEALNELTVLGGALTRSVLGADRRSRTR